MTIGGTTFINVPRDFQIACEAFGIWVPDFLQLIVRRVAFIHLFTDDNSEYDLATKSFAFATDLLKDQPELRVGHSLARQSRESLPHLQKLMKLTGNRSYSGRIKREKAAKLVEKLFGIASREIAFEPYIYYDEDTKITLTKDFLLMATINQYPPTVLLNAIMQCVSLADLYARIHLDRIVHNPVLGFYLRVQNGFGKLTDVQHINTPGFKNFMSDLQEFEIRYFTFRQLDQRREAYRSRIEENFQQINLIIDDE